MMVKAFVGAVVLCSVYSAWSYYRRRNLSSCQSADSKCKALCAAASREDCLEEFKSLVHELDYPNATSSDFKDEYGNSAFAIACESGNLEALKFLLSRISQFADISRHPMLHSVNKQGVNGFLLAVKANQTSVIKFLLNYSTMVSMCLLSTATEAEKWSALHLVASDGQLEMLELLLSKSMIDLDVQDIKGYTPLLMAACNGHSKIVEKLLEAKANMYLADHHDRSCLFLSSQNGHTETVRIILNKRNEEQAAQKRTKKSNLNVAKPHGKGSRQSSSNPTDILMMANKGGYTPLHMACLQSHLDIVRMLVEAGADVNITTADGSTPLHLASGRHSTLNDMSVKPFIIDYLLKQKELDVSKTAGKKDLSPSFLVDGKTFLHHVMENTLDNKFIQQILADKEIQKLVHLQDTQGSNCLHVMVHSLSRLHFNDKDAVQVAEMLGEANPTVLQTKDRSGQTAADILKSVLSQEQLNKYKYLQAYLEHAK